MCKCGHSKGQHPEGKCDYTGYSCTCSGYKKLKHGEEMDKPKTCWTCGKYPIFCTCNQ